MYRQAHDGEVPQLGASEAGSVNDFWKFLISCMVEVEKESCEVGWVQQWSEVAKKWRACGNPLFRPQRDLKYQHTHSSYIAFSEELCVCTWVSKNARLLPLHRLVDGSAVSADVEECACKLYASATTCYSSQYYTLEVDAFQHCCPRSSRA
jgi:hypothetical protein